MASSNRCLRFVATLCGPCWNRVVLPTDSEHTKLVKRSMVILWFTCIIPWVGIAAVTGPKGISGNFWMLLPSAAFVGTFSCFLVYSLVTRSLPIVLVYATLAVSFILGVVILDLHDVIHMKHRAWTIVVLLLDVVLLCKLPPITAYIMIAGAIFWLALVQTNFHADFGLFKEPWHEYEVPEICACARPPCTNLTFFSAMEGLLASLPILLIDFLLTRMFANAAEREKQTMQASIDTAELLALYLSAFDLDEARRVLDGSEGTMPAPLHRAFETILLNLSSYKPYLPISCLPDTVQQSPRNASKCRSEQSSSTEHSDARSSQGSLVASRGSSGFELSGNVRKPLMGLPGRHAIEEQQKPRWRRVSLMHLNVHHTLTLGSDDDLESVAPSYGAVFPLLLTHALDSFAACAGVVDLFLGDRILASCNASHPALKHAHGIARACKSLCTYAREVLGVEINVGLVSGRALCGDCGCENMRRYTVLGQLPVLAHAFERVGRTLQVPILCSQPFMRDVWVDHSVRMIVRQVAFVPRRCATTVEATPQCVFELLCSSDELPRQCSSHQGALQEWMYEVDARINQGWEKYNECVKLFLHGTSTADLVQLLGEAGFADKAEILLAQAALPHMGVIPYSYEY